ncbi:MAG: hypothetical protein JWP42_1724 [Pseudomonas sp.]|nr:hypothetical protein [Pseudomonas sp.]
MRNSDALPAPAPQIVRTMARRCLKHAPACLTHDDLIQEGAAAAWWSRYRWAEWDQPAAAVYLRQRVRGAMFDAIRKAWRSTEAPIDREQDDTPSGDDQEGDTKVRQACEALLMLPDPLPLIAVMAMAGLNGLQIGAQLGINSSSVSHRFATIEQRLRPYLGKP